jgi:hypothetical protein
VSRGRLAGRRRAPRRPRREGGRLRTEVEAVPLNSLGRVGLAVPRKRFVALARLGSPGPRGARPRPPPCGTAPPSDSGSGTAAWREREELVGRLLRCSEPSAPWLRSQRSPRASRASSRTFSTIWLCTPIVCGSRRSRHRGDRLGGSQPLVAASAHPRSHRGRAGEPLIELVDLEVDASCLAHQPVDRADLLA